MKLNSININEVSQFSNIEDVSQAITGRWAKYQDRSFRITMIKDVVIINTWGNCSIELFSHYPFKYTDDNGEHTVDEDTKSIDIVGIATFSYVYR